MGMTFFSHVHSKHCFLSKPDVQTDLKRSTLTFSVVNFPTIPQSPLESRSRDSNAKKYLLNSFNFRELVLEFLNYTGFVSKSYVSSSSLCQSGI